MSVEFQLILIFGPWDAANIHYSSPAVDIWYLLISNILETQHAIPDTNHAHTLHCIQSKSEKQTTMCRFHSGEKKFYIVNWSLRIQHVVICSLSKTKSEGNSSSFEWKLAILFPMKQLDVEVIPPVNVLNQWCANLNWIRIQGFLSWNRIQT